MPDGFDLSQTVSLANGKNPLAGLVDIAKQDQDILAAKAKDPVIQADMRDMSDAASKDSKRVKDAYSGIEPIGERLKPWDAQKELQEQQTNPLQTFGSLGSIFAIAASAFTRTPAINAMNGMAAAINAVKANDEEAYKKAYEAWKENMNLALERHRAQRDDYEDAMKLADHDMNAAKAKLLADSVKYDDALMRTHLELDDMAKISEIQNSRDASARGWAALKPELEAFGEHMTNVQAAIQKWRDTPEGKAWQQAHPGSKDVPIEVKQAANIAAARMEAEAKRGGGGNTMSEQEAAAVSELVSRGMSRTDAIAQVMGSAKGDTKTFTPQMGELAAALAERGVSLPAGMRSRAQQASLYQGLLERNPDKSADEIADLVKTGQIEFGAQKKETQVAAGVAGKVEVAQNEIQQFAPLVLDASDKVPRGNWVTINRLVQSADTAISDPNLKTLKIYVNSLLNAYDQLAARGGTDAAKREEACSLILTADGPEAFKAGVSAFLKEAEAAHRAAVEATKVPELSGTSKNAPTSDDPSKMSDDELLKKLGIK